MERAFQAEKIVQRKAWHVVHMYVWAVIGDKLCYGLNCAPLKIPKFEALILYTSESNCIWS